MSGIQSIREGLSGNLTRVIVVAIIITFIGSVGWAGFFSQGNVNVVASVGSQEITNTDLSFEVSTQQFTLSQRFPDQTIEDDVLLNLATNVLISKYAVLEFLEKNGVVLTDSFVFDQLSSEDQFIENGKFSKSRFDAYARSNGFIPSDYLQRVREDLLINIWRQTIASSSFLTNSELKKSIELAEQERDISFIKFPSEQFTEAVNYEDTDLLDFYDSNKDIYRSSEKVKVSYIYFDAEELKKSIEISQEAVALEYEEYINSFDTTIRKSVSHIMLNIDENKDSIQAQAELTEAKQRLVNGEGFSDLVLEISEDEGTKNLKGSLGVTDGTLLPPEFENALSNMQEGDVFGPIELASSVHLIKLDELIEPEPESLKNRSNAIIQDLTDQKAEDDFLKLLDEASELAFGSGSIADISENFSQELINTEYFSKEAAPVILQQDSVLDFIFNDLVDSNFPEVIEISPLSAVLIEVQDFTEETQLEYDKVQLLVKNAYVAEESARESRIFITNSIEELNGAKTLEIFSDEQSILLETYKNLKRDSSILPVRAVNEIFSLPRSKAGNVYGSSLTQNGDYLVYRLDSVREGIKSTEEINLDDVNNFLNQQNSISEMSELQSLILKGLSVQRYN